LYDREINVRASIGIALRPDDDCEPDELVRCADIAMYAAKRDGKARAIHFTANLDSGSIAAVDERLALDEDVRAGRLQTAFQPIIDSYGTQLGFEALARWTHRGVAVPPPRFIAMAERAGLIADLDLLVARNAIRYAASLDQQHRMLITVNVGASHLCDENMAQRLADALDDANIAHDRLVIELPESRAVDDTRMAVALDQIRCAGFKIAIDDFGTGFSNLARLAAIRPDILKIDRSLITPICDSAIARRVVRGAVGLAHDLGAWVIAEGVEHVEQHEALRELNCDAMQGFLFGQPEIPAVQEPGVAAA
jgi:EAL domain-containing protein (putative c-di-GMP-specific phosphodiesterase class I)